jgi:hypothetical protein
VAHSALRDKSKICLPPLYIKLSLTKISLKLMHKESKEFAYLRHKFPKISEANMKNEHSMIHKLHNYAKTKTLIQN